MPFETLRLQADGLTLAADAIGPADAPAVLFFHGGGQSRRSWRVAAGRVAEAGYRGITVDLRGHGESDWAEDGDYMLDAFARDVERLLVAFAGPVCLVGASRGGQAAFIAGARHPERISLIMLADIAPTFDNSGVEHIRGFFRASAAGFDTPDQAADALSQHLGQHRLPDASGLLRVMRRDAAGRLFWNWDPRTADDAFTAPPSEFEALIAAARQVRSPVVMVRAEFSSLVRPDDVAYFRILTPQLVVEEAKGAGHMFTGDRNDAFADRLITYLDRYAPLPARPHAAGAE